MGRVGNAEISGVSRTTAGIVDISCVFPFIGKNPDCQVFKKRHIGYGLHVPVGVIGRIGLGQFRIRVGFKLSQDRLLGNHANRTGLGVRPEHRTLRASQNLNSLHIIELEIGRLRATVGGRTLYAR